MAPIITTRRTVAALAAGGFITLVTALPAAAITDPGPPVPTSTGASSTVVREVSVDDGGLELLQVGLGALGGFVIAGAGTAAIGSRRQPKRSALASA